MTEYDPSDADRRRTRKGESGPTLFDPHPPSRGGETFDHEFDAERLAGQHARVYSLMEDGRWRTLDEIAALTGDPPASVSARLRDFRKPRFGAHAVERRARGGRERGLYEYRLGGVA